MVGQRERPGKTGLGSQADQTRTAKMFMLTIQEIQRAVSGAAHTAELLNNASDRASRSVIAPISVEKRATKSRRCVGEVVDAEAISVGRTLIERKTRRYA
jgi:hypothetical protein